MQNLLRNSVLALNVLFGLTLGGACAAQTEPPVVRLENLAPVSPEAARQYFESLAFDVSSSAGASSQALPVQPEIRELARALRDDVDLIYEYVYNQIELTPTFGLKKGPLGTLLDTSGNPFDQVNLFVELIREAGYSAEFVYGEIILDAADANAWLGTTGTVLSAGGVLKAGGIPVEYVGSGVLEIKFDHVWARVEINGIKYEFDPSFKNHAVSTALPDLDAILQYSKDGACGSDKLQSTCGLYAAAGGDFYSDGRLENLDVDAVKAKLDIYSKNLIDELRQNSPTASLEDIVGGLSIIPLVSSPRDTANPNLAPGTTPTIWTNSVPNEYRAQIRFSNNTDCSISGTLLFADQIDAQRLTVMPDGTSAAEMFLDGVSVVRWSGLSGELALRACVDQPYPTSTGVPPAPGVPGPGDNYGIVLNLSIDNSYGFSIINGWGDIGEERLRYHQKRLLKFRDEGLPETSEKVLGETLTTNGANWLAQSSASLKIANGLNDLRISRHNDIGVAGVTISPYVDIPGSNLSIVPADGRILDSRAEFFNVTGLFSAFEAATIEQMTEAFGVSTVTLFEKDISSGFGFYKIGTVQELLSANANLLSNGYTQIDIVRFLVLISDSTIDYDIFLPENAVIQSGIWMGNTYIITGKPYNTSFEEAGLVGYVIDGNKGGFSSLPFSSTQSANSASTFAGRILRSLSQFFVRGTLVSDPVNTFSGEYIYDNTDLTVGSRSFPYGLGFERQYSSGARLQNESIGFGWKHNFDISVSKYSNGARGLGAESPIDAAAMIVAQYVGRDLLNATVDLKPLLVTTLVQSWGAQHLSDNVVTVAIPGASVTFAKLPSDLGYNPQTGSTTKLTWDAASGFIYEELDGTIIKFRGNDGKFESWENANGFKVAPTYDASGLLTEVVNDFGWKLEFFYDTNDRIDTVSDTLGRSVSFGYDTDSNLTSFTDPIGETTSYIYDLKGRMTEIRYPSAPLVPFVTNVYDDLGRVKEQTNPKTGPNKPYKYYIAGTRSEEVDPYGNSRVWYQDNQGNITRMIDKLGRVATTEFDGLRRPLVTVLPEGNSIVYTYDDTTCVTRCTNNIESITRIPDVERGGPTLSEQFTYWGANKYFKLRKHTDARGNSTVNTYDSSGNLISVTGPIVDGVSPVTTYNYFNANPRRGILSKVTDPTGLVLQSIVQGTTGFLLETRLNPAGKNLKTKFGYDTWGNVKTETDPEGRITTSYFDCARRLRATVPPAPGSGTVLPNSRTTYNADGRVVFSSLVTGDVSGLECNANSGGSGTVIQQTEREYYDNGMLKKTISPDGATTSYVYDLLDRVKTITDPEGRKATTVFDAAGQVKNIQIIKGSFSLITGRFQYDLNGLNISVQDASLNRTEFIYNGQDRLIETHYPSLTAANTANPNDKEVYEYNGNGSLTKKTTRAGQDIVQTYDTLNRLTSKAPDGSQTIAYEYDLAGRQTEVSFATGAAHSITYGYDSAGRTTSVTDNGRTINYVLNKSSERVQLKWPDSPSISYQYDDAGRIISLNRGPASSAAPTNALVAYTYDFFGRRMGEQFGLNGAALTKTYGYFSDNSLDSLQIDLPGTANDVTFDLTYLPGNQIETKTISNPEYVYSAPFNKSHSYTANRLNQIESVVYDTGFTFDLTYDANGNLTSDGRQWIYTYDSENRLTKAVGRNIVASYSYDPLGRRASKTVSGGINEDIRYLYDGVEVIADTNTSDVVLRRYIYGSGVDEPIAMYAGSGTGVNIRRFYVAGPQGSVIGVVDASGALLDSHSYSPFGMPDEWAADTTGNPLRYTARRWDAESGLYFYRARYYSPALGRFLTTDPIGYADGLNVYAYVGNDPVNLVDPSGLGAQVSQSATGISTGDNFSLVQTSNTASSSLDGTAVRGGGRGGLRSLFATIVGSIFGITTERAPKDYAFHYSTKENIANIVATQTLNPSIRANNPKDARYGDGVYFSRIDPLTTEMTKGQISRALFGHPFAKRRVEAFVAVNIGGLNVVNPTPTIAVVPTITPLSIYDRIAGYGSVRNE